MAIGFPVKADYASGDVLTAANMNDLSGTLNSIESVEYAAGKNKIINGDFGINQRNFTSITTTNTYSFDRFVSVISGDGTTTITPQTFTPGTAPVSGYEATNYWRAVTSGYTNAASRTDLSQRIEDVRTFAGQTVTLSFWAKAASGTPKIAFEIFQEFGTAGSASVGTAGGTVTISTSWARYSKTITLPSVSGKTIGAGSLLNTRIFVNAGSDFAARTDSMGIQNNTFDIWGYQLEASSTATAFQTATGTLQGELAACQRYYVRYGGESSYNAINTSGFGTSTTRIDYVFQFPVKMRIAPSAIDYSTVSTFLANAGSSTVTPTSFTIDQATTYGSKIDSRYASGVVADRCYYLMANNNATSYVAFTAEL
jgi:hypothetical protein